MAARIAECMRDAAYAASVDLAREKGVPQFDATGYLAEGTFASRLPESLQAAIARTASATATCCRLPPRAR